METTELGDDGLECAASPPKKKIRIRGATKLPVLVKNNDGTKKTVNINHLGQPKRKNQEKFQSYLGLMTRITIPIKYTWKEVPSTLKDKLWAAIESRFDVDPGMKNTLLVGCGENWKTWKSRLTTKYILPFKDQPDQLARPPSMYPFIKQEHWDAFVKTRITQEFQEIHDSQSDRRSQNVYNHRTGRAGYTGLMEDLVENGEFSIDEIDRTVLWKMARQKKGEYKNEVVKEKADEIDEYNQDNSEDNNGIDTLTGVFGEDSRGKVRAIGKYVTPTAFFHMPRRRSSQKPDEEKERHKQEKENWLKENANLRERLEKLEQAFAEKAPDKSSVASHQQKVLPTYSESANSPDPKKSTARSPHRKSTPTSARKKIITLVKKKVMPSTSLPSKKYVSEKLSKSPHHQSPMQPVGGLTQRLGLGMGQPCKLYIGSKIVATGNVYHSNENDKLHTVPLGKNNYRVEVKYALEGHLALPIPVEGEMETVRQAIGSHVAWPKRLVIIEKTNEDTTCPDVFGEFLSRAKTILEVQGNYILLTLGAEVFSSEKDEDFYLSLDDISYISESTQASVIDVVLYIRLLHEKIVSKKMEKKFGFLNPIGLCSQKVDNLNSELIRVLSNATTEFVFIPYVKNFHWILMVVKLETMKIWWLDPAHEKEVRFNLRTIMNTVAKGSRLVDGKRKLRDPVWITPPSVPKQTGDWECGYYVMRYMKDIIDDKPNPVTNLQKFEKDSYTEDDINEVRIEWITYLEQYL